MFFYVHCISLHFTDVTVLLMFQERFLKFQQFCVFLFRSIVAFCKLVLHQMFFASLGVFHADFRFGFGRHSLRCFSHTVTDTHSKKSYFLVWKKRDNFIHSILHLQESWKLCFSLLWSQLAFRTRKTSQNYSVRYVLFVS